MKEHNEIDLLFQSALDGLELAPDPSVKENIDHAIASKKKRRRFLFILFPMLLGTTAFAALRYFYPFSEKTIQNPSISQNSFFKTGKRTTNPASNVIQSKKTNEKSQPVHEPKTEAPFGRNENRKKRMITQVVKSTDEKTEMERAAERKYVNFDDSHKTSTLTRQPKIKSSFIIPATGTEDIVKSEETNKAKRITENPENESNQQPDTTIVSETKPDSTAVTSQPDSSALIISEVLNQMGTNKGVSPWSLSVLTYWEGEKKRAIPSDNEPFVANQKENARIHSSTFYGKIEINRQLTQRLEILTGLGFRSSKIVQHGYLSKIEFPIQGVSSGVPQPITPPIPDTIHRTETQSFRVNSIVLPIGLAYSFPIGNKIKLRLSGGGEFAYGQFANKQLNPDLSAPKLNSFGCNVWLRPEFHYVFGRTELIGFGTFNQPLAQQLKWEFEPRRNAAFGGGIGLRIRL